MTAPAAQWQLDRLSTAAREAAEIASLGAGVSLSHWLNRLIGETCAAEGVAPPREPSKILEFTRDRAPSGPVGAPVALPAPQSIPSPSPASATMIPVAAIVAANLGTRRGTDVPDALLDDIATRGVRQPLMVRRSAANPEGFELICGHRRWRAAQRVGLAHIAAMIVTREDAEAILASLAENLHLGTLSVIEEAQAYLRLLTQCAIDASAVTAATARDRKHIVRCMRLLGLPPLVRHLIAAGLLSRDHAYLLLEAPHPEALADAILTENLTVEAARQRLAPSGAERKP